MYNLINGVSSSQMMAQPLQFPPNSPPAVPQIPGCPVQLAPYIPEIAAAVATNAGMGAASLPHAGRIYTFNVLASNGYSNNEFATAVSTVADWIVLHISKGAHGYGYDNMTWCINDAATRVITIMTSMNIVNHPQLQSQVEPQVVNESRRIVEASRQFQQEINQLKQKMSMDPRMMGYGGPMVPGAHPGMMPGQPMVMMPQPIPPGYQHPQPGVYPQAIPPGYQHPQPVYNPAMHRPVPQSTFSSPMFVTDPNAQAASMQSGFFRNEAQPSAVDKINNDRYASLAASGSQVRGQNPPMAVHHAVPVAVPPPPTVLIPRWKASSLQWYPEIYNSRTESIDLKLEQDPVSKEPCVVLNIIKKVEAVNMDRSLHQVTGPRAQATLVPSGFATRDSAVRSSLSEVSSAISAITSLPDAGAEPAEPIEVTPNVHAEWFMTSTLDEMIFNARFNHAVALSGRTYCTAYTTFAVLCEPILTKGSFFSTVATLEKQKTFNDIHAYMSDILGMQTTKESERNFILAIDTYLTRELNAFFAKELLLSSFDIDSFLADWPKVIDYVQTNRGHIYRQSIEKNQRLIIRRIFNPMQHEEENDELVNNILPAGERDKNGIYATLLPKRVSVTVIDVNSEELGIGFYEEGMASRIRDSAFPELHKYAEAITSIVTDSDEIFANHYIVTSDSKVFELHVGLVGNGGEYLLSVYKPAKP